MKTIEQLSQFEGGASAEHQIKTLVYMADEKPVLALLRGDHQLNESKLSAATGAGQLRAANDEEIFALLSAHAGSLGAVGVEKDGLQVLADEQLRGRARMTTGANRDGFHLRGVDAARDIPNAKFVDLREAQAGEQSPNGGGALVASRCIELGHIFKLGNKYSRAMGATFLDSNGKTQIMEMGCYGLGVPRVMATLAETSHDDRGVIWPANVAPFDVHLLQLERDEAMGEIAQKIYEALKARGIDVLWDDRNERPGAKFADADLFGIPQRVLIGKTTRESGQVEWKQRSDGSSQNVDVDEVIEQLIAQLKTS